MTAHTISQTLQLFHASMKQKRAMYLHATVADWVLIIGLKISHFFATALILKACIEQEIQLGCYQMNTVTAKDT